jgi:hypothetical protein
MVVYYCAPTSDNASDLVIYSLGLDAPMHGATTINGALVFDAA